MSSCRQRNCTYGAVTDTICRTPAVLVLPWWLRVLRWRVHQMLLLLELLLELVLLFAALHHRW